MNDPNQQLKYRLRLTFAKKKQIKYIAHLDLALAWERALRRADIPLAYSQGFNPRPKMQIASSLPLGTIGRAEIIDIIITQPISSPEALKRIRVALPPGLELKAVKEVPRSTSALQHLLRQAVYTVTVETEEITAEELNRRIEALLSADTIIQTRHRKKRKEEFDLRPWLYELRLESMADRMACLYMRLAAGQFGNLRPETLLKALNLTDFWSEIERVKLVFVENSEKNENSEKR